MGVRALLSRTCAHGASNNRLTTSEKLFAIPAWWQSFGHRRHLEFSAQINAMYCVAHVSDFPSGDWSGWWVPGACWAGWFDIFQQSFHYCKFFSSLFLVILWLLLKRDLLHLRELLPSTVRLKDATYGVSSETKAGIGISNGTTASQSFCRSRKVWKK